MHESFSNEASNRVAQTASRRLALPQPHPRGSLLDLVYVLLEVRSGYKSLITF